MEKRSLASSIAHSLISNLPHPEWTEWSTRKSVREGYKKSGWVHRAIYVISSHFASVPWSVEDAKSGEKIPQHHLSRLLARPNPGTNSRELTTLVSSWQQLSGESYLHKVKVGNQTREIWPISPDRIAPIPGLMNHIIGGYEVIDEKNKKIKSNKFTPETVISIRLVDPANPHRGISPLQVAARAVDTDTEQTDWNKSAMQNRAVLDGVFLFDREIKEREYDSVLQRVKEMFSGSNNARNPGVLGSSAKYQRMGLTPAEMDFIVSRRFNREEIFIIFGVPPQLAGIQDASTYNNYSTSMRIFWELTMIPLLENMKAALNDSFADELSDGLVINYDVSWVPALKQTKREKAEISQIYYNMGVPVNVLNEMFALGIPEYTGWDRSSNDIRLAMRQAEPNTAGIGNTDEGTQMTNTRNVDISKVSEVIHERMEGIKNSIEAAKTEENVLRAVIIGFKAIDDELRESLGYDVYKKVSPEITSFSENRINEIRGLINEMRQEKYKFSFVKSYVNDVGLFSEGEAASFVNLVMSVADRPN